MTSADTGHRPLCPHHPADHHRARSRYSPLGLPLEPQPRQRDAGESHHGPPLPGINILLLNLQQVACGYPVNRWLTFQQASSAGARLRRGETGTRIVFFKLLERDEDGPPRPGLHPKRKVIPLLRSFTVFNAAQVDGLPEPSTEPALGSTPWSPVAAAEALLRTSGAHIQHGGIGCWRERHALLEAGQRRLQKSAPAGRS